LETVITILGRSGCGVRDTMAGHRRRSRAA